MLQFIFIFLELMFLFLPVLFTLCIFNYIIHHNIFTIKKHHNIINNKIVFNVGFFVYFIFIFLFFIANSYYYSLFFPYAQSYNYFLYFNNDILPIILNFIVQGVINLF